jgi:hypothetical protein
MPSRSELFLATFAAGRSRAATFAGPMLAHLRLIGLELRRLDTLLARGIRFGCGLPLLLLLLPRRRLVRRRARCLRRWRHAVIGREGKALGFGLGMQGGSVIRTAREAVNDLRPGVRRWRGFHLSRRRRQGGRLFRLRDIDRPQNRHNSDECGKSEMDAGTSHAASLKRAGRNSDNGSYVKTAEKDSENRLKEPNRPAINKRLASGRRSSAEFASRNKLWLRRESLDLETSPQFRA